jgi:hypothetical protein
MKTKQTYVSCNTAFGSNAWLIWGAKAVKELLSKAGSNQSNSTSLILTATEQHFASGVITRSSAILRLLYLTTLTIILLMSMNSNAAPVIVGSVNPETKQVLIFQDFLVKQFLDGTPILNTYGKYDEYSKSYIMVRAGKTASGSCQTDAFKLVRLTGNRLALTESPLDTKPWNGIGSILQIKLCFSSTCQGSCQVLGDTSTPHDLEDYICHCSSGSANQKCEKGLVLLHDLDDIVWQEPLP